MKSVKFFPGDLNSGPYSHIPYLTSTYICEVTITPKIYGDNKGVITMDIYIYINTHIYISCNRYDL